MKAVYNEGDIVVFKNDDKYNVGIVTNVRKKKNQLLGYDIRSERGSAYTLVQVDKEKSKYSIDSNLTAIFLQETDEPTKLYIDKSLGHTRANYNEDVEMTIDHYEKCADFSFPVVGPRSF
jgi:signal peptidase I